MRPSKPIPHLINDYSRMIAPSRRFLLCALSFYSLAPVAALDAQTSVRVEAQGTTATLVNGLPLRVVGFVRELADATGATARIVTVDPNASVALGSVSRNFAVEQFEVASPSVALRNGWKPPCVKFDAAALQNAIRSLQAQFDAQPLEQSRQGQEALQLAASLAQLKHERARDSIRLIRNDPVTAFYRDERMARANSLQYRKEQDRQISEQNQQLLDNIGRSMSIYAEEAAAKYGVLSQDASRYKELMESSEQSLAMMRLRVTAVQREVARQAEYQQTILDAIEHSTTVSSSEPSVSSAGVRRSCSGAVNLSDVVELSAQLPMELAVLVGEARFDSGEQQPVLLRREKGTDRWIGRVSWPGEASELRFRVRGVNSRRWTDVPGSVRTGRETFASLLSSMEEQAKSARKKYDDASFRAKGQDHIKSMIVPQ